MNGETTSALIAFFDFAFKGMFILLLAALADIIFRKANASLRHLIWIIALAALLFLPAVSPLIPRLDIPMLNFLPFQSGALNAGGLDADNLEALGAQGALLSVENVLLTLVIIYAAGVLAVFVWQLSGRVHAIRIRKDAAVVDEPDITNLLADVRKDLRIQQHVELLVTNMVSAPFSIGLLKPAVILPKGSHTWPRSILRSVLTHELAHIKRRDLFSRAIAQLACCLSWFNPLAWFGFRRLLIEQEIACDNYVLSSGSKPSEYAHNLLAVANIKRSFLDYAMAAIGRKRELKDRLMEILKPKRSKNPLKGGRSLLFIFLALMLLLPVFILNIWNENPTAQASDAVHKKSKLIKHESDKKKPPVVEHDSEKPEGSAIKPRSAEQLRQEAELKEKLDKLIIELKKKGMSDKEIKEYIEKAKIKIQKENEAAAKIKFIETDKAKEDKENETKKKQSQEQEPKKKSSEGGMV